jgi:non-canonical (house-cleaning) NTP pyrophosphatase
MGRRAIDEYFEEPKVLSGQGPIGVLTCGRMSRTHASMEAVICALTRFVNPKYY